MKEESFVPLIIAILLVLAALFMVGLFSFLNSLDIRDTENMDDECNRLGYDKGMKLGFSNYCLNVGVRIEVVGTCSPNRCDFYIK